MYASVQDQTGVDYMNVKARQRRVGREEHTTTERSRDLRKHSLELHQRSERLMSDSRQLTTYGRTLRKLKKSSNAVLDTTPSSNYGRGLSRR